MLLSATACYKVLWQSTAGWAFLKKSHLGAGGDGIPACKSITQLGEESVKLQNIPGTSERKTHQGIFQKTGALRQLQPKNEKGRRRVRERKRRKKCYCCFNLYSFEKEALPPTNLIFLNIKRKGKKQNYVIGGVLRSKKFPQNTKCPSPWLLRHFWHILLLEFVLQHMRSSCFKPQRHRKTGTWTSGFSHIKLKAT